MSDKFSSDTDCYMFSFLVKRICKWMSDLVACNVKCDISTHSTIHTYSTNLHLKFVRII